MRVAARHGLRVVARGGGSKLGWGAPPSALDLILDTSGINGIVEHASGDLVVVARAGTSYDDLQATAAGSRQRLALDSSLPGATLGGIVATGASGPRRLLYGTMRDLLIGVTFVRADGVVAKSGGKVVKNVAGYDFGKLLTGSFGTLAVVTQVALRLHPQPAESRYVVREVESASEAADLTAAVLRSQVVPSAVEVDRPPEGPLLVAVLLEGISAGVVNRAQTVATLLDGGSVTEQAPRWFGSYPFSAGEVGLKVTAVMSGVGPLLEDIDSVAQRYDARVHVRGSAAGVLYAGLQAGSEADVVAMVADLRRAADKRAGSVVVLTAPDDGWKRIDRWGTVRGLALMHSVKDELDPEHRLAPGRFVGGI
jgi:glycolate oxidase FAD binding subunit